MDLSSLGMLALGFVLGSVYWTQWWQSVFLTEIARLLLSSGCSLAAAKRGGPSPSVGLELRSARRVAPLDLDVSTGHLHQNNVRYFDQLQQERIKFLFRSGLIPALHRHGLQMALVDMHVRFRRELRPGQAYEIVTKLCGWSDSDAVYLECTFVTDNGKMVNGVVYHKLKLKFRRDGAGVQTAPELMGSITTGSGSGDEKSSAVSPMLPECVLHWEAANKSSSEAYRKAAGLSPTISADAEPTSKRRSHGKARKSD
jgi:acyl-CoA thioesterase FadM